MSYSEPDVCVKQKNIIKTVFSPQETINNSISNNLNIPVKVECLFQRTYE